MNKNQRQKRSDIAKNTLSIIEQGYYTNTKNEAVNIRATVNDCVNNTALYIPDILAALEINQPFDRAGQLEVMNETTLEGAKRLSESGKYRKIAVLNFASAKNAGGGFLGGSQAQEESLARSSALYESLQQCSDYYQYHRRRNRSLLYSHHMIYSPDCPVLRLDNGDLLDKPYLVDFITSPAPNRGAIERNEPRALDDLETVFSERIGFVLRLAASQQCDALVLGAWGCGVFGNQPEHVASLFADLLKASGEFANTFEYISFSIPESGKTVNNTAFTEKLA